MSIVFLVAISSFMSTLASSGSLAVTGGMSQAEHDLVNEIQGESIARNASHMENLAKANFASRSAGSLGANQTADWILSSFVSAGLSAAKEYFPFKTWDLTSRPSLVVDRDGSDLTQDDREQLMSFNCEHWSKPTPSGGANASLAVLPLPPAETYSDLGANPLSTVEWNQVDVTGRVLVIGREVRWVSSWESSFIAKITAQRPAAVVFVWWYDWMAGLEGMFSSSAGGKPGSQSGPYFWYLGLPVGGVNYTEGLLLRDIAQGNATALVEVESKLANAQQCNVAARIEGEIEPNRSVLVTAHYDSVLTPGFCDNAGGVSSVLEIARVLSQAKANGSYHPHYSITFVAFSGEELGYVGSINYVRMHPSEVSKAVAVINLDCIGARTMVITRTEPDSMLDLDEVLLQCALDLGVSVVTEEPSGSDQDVFLDPEWAAGYYQQAWGLDAKIASVPPVLESVMLASQPILYYGIWYDSEVGWIHTPRDGRSWANSTGWVTNEYLQQQTQVALLGLVRISSGSPVPAASGDDTLLLVGASVVLAAVIISGTLVWKGRHRPGPPQQG
ncbi:MAG: M28 family peptidase [Methanomassiliicoccales archaeon]|nr:M28 family peptidase [Methanomassiliicoccales archaeon]